MTNKQYRESIGFRIKAIKFDIECLSGGQEGRIRNAKAIEALEKAVEDYERKVSTIPDDEVQFGR